VTLIRFCGSWRLLCESGSYPKDKHLKGRHLTPASAVEGLPLVSNLMAVGGRDSVRKRALAALKLRKPFTSA
jgi:hypothetical protein